MVRARRVKAQESLGGRGSRESGEVRRRRASGEFRGRMRSLQEISGVMRSRGLGEARNPERQRVRKGQGEIRSGAKRSEVEGSG